jgi:hypothetical protein
MQYIFSAMSGYNDVTAKSDLDSFFHAPSYSEHSSVRQLGLGISAGYGYSFHVRSSQPENF